MTCPHCGARNTPDAPWCTQCLQPLGQPDPPAEPAPPAPPRSPDPPPAAIPPAPGSSPAPEAGDRDVRSVDGVVEWRCPTCQSWNALDRPACSVCGQALAATVTGTGRDQIAGQVSRVRRVLWIAAGVGAVLMVVAVVLLVLAMRGGAA